MELLEKILKELLNEEVQADKVIDAIKKRYEVKITYAADDDKKGQGERIIQPVAYGTTKAGNPVIRAFQPYGDTKTKTPKWKFFRLDRITGWKGMKNVKFSEPPGMEWQQMGAEGKFNENGDDSMAEVFVIADFKNTKARYERGGLKRYNDDVQKQKYANNPFYGLKKNIEKAKQRGHFATIDKNVELTNKQRQQQINNRGNSESIKDMQQAQNFPTNDFEVNGPVTKQGKEVKPVQKTQNNYNKAKVNGPVFKQDYQDFEEQPQENKLTDNNLENNIENGRK